MYGMDMTFDQKQTIRVADVSLALDDLATDKQRDRVWQVAARRHAQGDVSFLQALEIAVAAVMR